MNKRNLPGSAPVLIATPKALSGDGLPNYTMRVVFSLDGLPRQTLDLEMVADKRYRSGALTVHGLNVKVDGKNVIGWASGRLSRIRAKSCNGTIYHAVPKKEARP